MSAVNNHPTHGQVSPSGVHGYVMDSYRPVPDQLRLTLGKLDGQEKYTYSIWRTTAPGDLHLPISDERAVRVFSNEVFTADEAAVIFSTYYLTDTVSQEYALRELDLTDELSEKR